MSGMFSGLRRWAASFAAPTPGTNIAAARDLAQLMSPSELFVHQRVRGSWRRWWESVAADPRLQAREQEHPGINAAIWSVTEVELRRLNEQAWSRYIARLAEILADSLSQQEIDVLRQEYSRPVRQKFMRDVDHEVDRALEAEQIGEASAPTSRLPHPQLIETTAVRTVAGRLTAEELEELGALDRVLPMERLSEVSRRTSQFSDEFARENFAQWNAYLGDLADQVGETYRMRGATRH
jgi:hypothetical protein